MTTEWTVKTLKEHIDALFRDRDERFRERFDSQEKAVDSALASAEKAVTKAEAATEKRFDGVNEFRQALSDQSRDLLPRKEYEAQHMALEQRLVAVERNQTRQGGKSQGADATLAKIISVLAVIVAVASVIALSLKK